jgi:Lrp/AsnC family transcriptional regulator
VTNARGYDAFYRSLIKEVSIFNVTSALSMEEIKSTTALPLPGLTPEVSPAARP